MLDALSELFHHTRSLDVISSETMRLWLRDCFVMVCEAGAGGLTGGCCFCGDCQLSCRLSSLPRECVVVHTLFS